MYDTLEGPLSQKRVFDWLAFEELGKFFNYTEAVTTLLLP